MSQAAGALRATERAERAGRAGRAEMQRAPAASRWTAPSRRAVVQGALGLTAAGLTAAAVYECKKLTEKYRLIVLSGDVRNKGVARELSWTQMMPLCTLLKNPQIERAEFSSDSILRANSVFKWNRLDGKVHVVGEIHRPLNGSVVACIDGDTAECSVLSGEVAQKRIPGVVETSGGTKKTVSAVSAAMAYTWLKVTLRNARRVSNGIGWVSVRAFSDENGNWLDPPAECTSDVTNFSIKCHSGGYEATRTEQTIPIAQIHVKVNKRKWFDALFGFSDKSPKFERNGEDALERNKSKFEYDILTGVLRSRSVRVEWHAGLFTTKRLSDLRKSRLADTRGKTTVRFVRGDVAILHGDPEYAGAVFLASSNLDCLQHEAWSVSVTRASGVADYVYQKTQGAACAISCAPGTIVRNYFARDTEVNTLSAVIERLSGGAEKRQLLDVSHGTAYARDAADLPALSTKIDGLSDGDREETMGLLEVGVQEDTEVTCAKLVDGNWYRVVRGDPALRVTQVLAGALQFEYDTVVGWSSLASLVFEAAYEATLHVAKNATRTVVLTALCGEDAPKWLAEATAAALGRALAKFEDAGLDVVINEPRQGVYVYKKIWETLLSLGPVSRTPHFGHASAESYKAKLYTE